MQVNYLTIGMLIIKKIIYYKFTNLKNKKLDYNKELKFP